MQARISDGNATFVSDRQGRCEYTAFVPTGQFPSPQLVGQVSNQDIHGQPTPDMIIVTPAAFMAQAKRVAAMHESVDSMRVLVVEQDEVFNEFSSGTPDAMAFRMMNKMFYDRGTSDDGHRLGYFLLMGNGSFDNRQLSTAVKSLDYPMLLTWQTSDSNDELTSYTSDDPFAVLADNSGPDFYRYDLDIAVGRMVARSTSEMRTVVDKLINYVTVADPGSWRNQVLDVADDRNHAVHMIDAEESMQIGINHGGTRLLL